MSSRVRSPVHQRQVHAGRPDALVPAAGLALDGPDDTGGDQPIAAAADPSRPADSLEPGDAVVVRTAEGPALATVTRAIPRSRSARRPAPDSGDTVVRRATHEDIVTRLKQQQREQDAQRICLLKIRERGLAMKLTRVEQLFDGSRLIFYYTAEGRVDFRELVRDLAAHFRTRIEMRQIGVRDEARCSAATAPAAGRSAARPGCRRSSRSRSRWRSSRT